MMDLVHLEEDLGEYAVNVDPVACVLRAIRGIYAAFQRCGQCVEVVERRCEDVGIVTVSNAAGLHNELGGRAATDTKPDTTDFTARHRSRGAAYRQSMQVLYLGGLVVARDDIIPEIKRRIRLATVLLQSVQAGVVRFEGSHVHSGGAHAKGRGDIRPAERGVA